MGLRLTIGQKDLEPVRGGVSATREQFPQTVDQKEVGRQSLVTSRISSLPSLVAHQATLLWSHHSHHPLDPYSLGSDGLSATAESG